MLSYIYGKIMDLRNALYDKGVFEVHDLGARVISIGNITTGGTGKTPLVAYVAEILATRGEKVCILTRGYGRRDANKRVLVSDGETIIDDAEITGDEPLELANKLKEKAIVIADADRVAAAEWAKRKFGVTVFVLDDGFQHRKARRDMDIVCIDAKKPLGEMQMLPAGHLREPLTGLKRADVIVITRSDLVDASTIQNLRYEISNWNDRARIFEMGNKISDLRELKSNLRETGDLGGRNVYAFCGLGDPDNFFDMLRREGLETRETRAFADHHKYTWHDMEMLEVEAEAWLCNFLVTTAKDAVKLKDLNLTIPCYVAEIEVVIDDPEGFAAML